MFNTSHLSLSSLLPPSLRLPVPPGVLLKVCSPLSSLVLYSSEFQIREKTNSYRQERKGSPFNDVLTFFVCFSLKKRNSYLLFDFFSEYAECTKNKKVTQGKVVGEYYYIFGLISGHLIFKVKSKLSIFPLLLCESSMEVWALMYSSRQMVSPLRLPACAVIVTAV